VISKVFSTCGTPPELATTDLVLFLHPALFMLMAKAEEDACIRPCNFDVIIL
jgi:hypothetical protein